MLIGLLSDAHGHALGVLIEAVNPARGKCGGRPDPPPASRSRATVESPGGVTSVPSSFSNGKCVKVRSMRYSHAVVFAAEYCLLAPLVQTMNLPIFVPIGEGAEG